MKRVISLSFLLLFVVLGAPAVFAQTGEPLNVYDLSLEDLFDISIVSASKKEEKLFDAPVSSYSISREEISKAGISSIPEALRLCPDVVVRETTNGNYDIHIRGFDNVAQKTPTTMQVNAYTLVMINNRPIINYIQGAAFWETLPVSMVDVERIEVIRGPSAALFGPNAVTGVINIITRNVTEKDWQLSAQVQYALPGTAAAAGISVGKMVSKKLSMRFSTNYEGRQRLDDQHFNYFSGKYISSEEYLQSKNGTQLDPEMSLRRYGANLYADLRVSEDTEWKLAAGYNHAESQKVYFMNESPLTFSKMQGQYVNLSARHGALNARVSYSTGTDDLHRTSNVFTAKYDYSMLDLDVNYNIDLAKWISITPSLSFFSNTYADDAYSKTLATNGKDWYGGILDSEQYITTQAASLRTEIKPLHNLRIIASGRVDKFNNYNKEKKLSYQFASTYTPVPALLLRANYSRATSGFFHGYANMKTQIPISGNTILEIHGNELLELTASNMAELGLRVRVSDRYQADVAIFSQTLENVVAYQHEDTRRRGGKTYLIQGYLNAPLEARQQGVSFSLNTVPSDRLQIRPYFTLQETILVHQIHPTHGGGTTTTVHENTPGTFGGLFVNWQPLHRLNVNMNAYYFADHVQSHLYSARANNKAEGLIDAKLLANVAFAYQIMHKVKVSMGAKDLLNQQSREFFAADRTGRTYNAGISYNF